MSEYICNICKQAPPKDGWPRRYKWKTEKGFKNHRCYKDELEARKKWEEEEAKRKAKLEKELQERIKNSKYEVGDEVFYWSYRVTKPTHEPRGPNRRLVRVKYEEERKYFSAKGKIEKITLHGYIIHGINISENNICSSLEDAEKRAKERQEAHQKHLELAARCR